LTIDDENDPEIDNDEDNKGDEIDLMNNIEE